MKLRHHLLLVLVLVSLSTILIQYGRYVGERGVADRILEPPSVGNPASPEYQEIYMTGWNAGSGRCDSTWHNSQAELSDKWEWGYDAGFLDAIITIYGSDSVLEQYQRLRITFRDKYRETTRWNDSLRGNK